MTTVLALIKDKTVMAADGQITYGDTIFKHTTKKIRRVYDGKVLVGFSGSTADALALLERFEGRLNEFSGDIVRASVELAKEWRMDRALRRLEAMLLVADKSKILIITGIGDVIQPDEQVAAIGSGGPYALAAAKALLRNTDLPAEKIVEEAMKISSDISIYSNHNFTIEIL